MSENKALQYRVLKRASKENDIDAVADQIDKIRLLERCGYRKIANEVLPNAISHGSEETVAFLLDKRDATTDGVTPLDLAGKPTVALLEKVIAHGYDINKKQPWGGGTKGWRLLQFVLDDEEIVRWCLEHGATTADSQIDPNLVQPPALLDTACASGSITTVKLLKERGAKSGRRMLHFAALTAASCSAEDILSKMEMVRFLVEEQGCDVNAMDADKPLPMHSGTPIAYASANVNGGKEIVQYLLEKGADPMIHNMWGACPLEYVRKNGNKDVLTLMEKHLQLDQHGQ